MPNIDYDFDWDKEQKNKLDLQKLVDEGKSLAIVMPQSSSDLLWINSMLSNLKELYPQHKIYIFTKPEFYSFIDDNPNDLNEIIFGKLIKHRFWKYTLRTKTK